MPSVDAGPGDTSQRTDSAQCGTTFEVRLQWLILNQRELGAQLEQLFDALAHGDPSHAEHVASHVATLCALGVELHGKVVDSTDELATHIPGQDRPMTVVDTIALVPVPAVRARLTKQTELLAVEIERVAIARLRIDTLIRDLGTLQHQTILAFERLGTIDPLYGNHAQGRNISLRPRLLNTSA